MTYLLKTALALFLIGWTGFGGWMIWKFAVLFGPHPDDPAESPGARYYGVTHVAIDAAMEREYGEETLRGLGQQPAY